MITNPVGIDYPIQELQQLFIDELWPDIAADKKEFNHRVFKNERKDLIIPEVFVKDREYREVKFNDKLTVLSWFDVADNTNSFDAGQINQNVGIFFAVNLKELYSILDHRSIEEAHRDVLKLLDYSNVIDIINGAGAYGDFDISNLKKYNMQPWHVFRINYLIEFNVNC